MSEAIRYPAPTTTIEAGPEQLSAAEAWQKVRTAVHNHLANGGPDSLDQPFVPEVPNQISLPVRESAFFQARQPDLPRFANQYIKARQYHQSPEHVMEGYRGILRSEKAEDYAQYPATALLYAHSLIKSLAHEQGTALNADYLSRHPDLHPAINDLVGNAINLIDQRQADGVGLQVNATELTSLTFVVGALPRGTIDQTHTGDILRHNLAQLHEMDSSERLVTAALGRLDLSNHGGSAATLLTLVMRHAYRFKESGDVTTALRALTNLVPEHPANNTAILALAAGINNRHQNPPTGNTGRQIASGLCLLEKRKVATSPEAREAAHKLAQEAIAATRKRLAKEHTTGAHPQTIEDNRQALNQLEGYLRTTQPAPA